MNRTAFIEVLKQMRFEEAYDGYQAKRLSQEEAARYYHRLIFVTEPLRRPARPLLPATA